MIFIRGIGNISPQKTWSDDSLLADPLTYAGDRLTCHEPEYPKYIDPKQLRRMSRIIKMGVAAGSMALKQAGVSVPNGIITGTSYGCLEDTGIFLSKMIENKEHALNPTPFIQSTHNTIGSQIALLLQCQGYNQTYTQGAFSFENALLDAVLELKETPGQSLLVGGVDETTNVSHTLLKRFGIYRAGSDSSLNLFRSQASGTLHGEGAVYVVLSGEKSEQAKVCLNGVTTFYKPSDDTLRKGIQHFLESNGLQSSDIDLILLGKCGDQRLDAEAEKISSSLFSSAATGVFKHLCGEYPTASSFAFWLGAKIMEENHIPEIVVTRKKNGPIKRTLIYNPYFGTHHSLILLSTC
jgi:3-oxoacyl-[acyl-carrier-protein] synthase II